MGMTTPHTKCPSSKIQAQQHMPHTSHAVKESFVVTYTSRLVDADMFGVCMHFNEIETERYNLKILNQIHVVFKLNT